MVDNEGRSFPADLPVTLHELGLNLSRHLLAVAAALISADSDASISSYAGKFNQSTINLKGVESLPSVLVPGLDLRF